MYEEIIEANLLIHNAGEYPRRKYRVDCPYCAEKGKSPDNGGHFSLFIDNWWGTCHRCGSKAHARDALTKLGIQNLPREDINDALRRMRDSVSRALDKKEEVFTLQDAPEMELPAGTWLPFTAEALTKPWFAVALREIRRWKMTPEMAIAARWRWNITKSAFLFPTYMDGRLVFWQTRSIGGMRGGPSGNFESYGILGNWDDPLRHTVDTVYIVEGPKDTAAMSARGLWAVCLHSHHISKSHEMRLKALPHRKVILFDADVAASSMKMESAGWDVAYLPEKDPSKIGDNLKEVVESSTGLVAQVTQIMRAKQVEKLPFDRRSRRP